MGEEACVGLACARIVREWRSGRLVTSGCGVELAGVEDTDFSTVEWYGQ